MKESQANRWLISHSYYDLLTIRTDILYLYIHEMSKLIDLALDIDADQMIAYLLAEIS